MKLRKIEKTCGNRSFPEEKMERWSVNHLCNYSINLIEFASGQGAREIGVQSRS